MKIDIDDLQERINEAYKRGKESNTILAEKAWKECANQEKELEWHETELAITRDTLAEIMIENQKLNKQLKNKDTQLKMLQGRA